MGKRKHKGKKSKHAVPRLYVPPIQVEVRGVEGIGGVHFGDALLQQHTHVPGTARGNVAMLLRDIASTVTGLELGRPITGAEVFVLLRLGSPRA